MAKPLSIGDKAFGAAIAFVCGILAASFPWNLWFAVAAWLITLPVLIKFLGKKASLLFAATLAGGFAYYHAYGAWQTSTMRLPFHKELSFTAVVAEEPKESDTHELFTADPWRSHPLMILAPPQSGFHYGDLIQVRGIIDKPDTPHDDPFAISSRITLIAHGRGFWLRQILLEGKSTIETTLEKFLSRDQASLTAGIAIGGSAEMGSDLKRAMAASGTSYILSMYGYKMAAMVSAASIALKNFFSRKITLATSAAIITLFVVMAGFDAVVIRAAIATALGVTAKEIGRPVDKRNAFAFTAALMLCFDPTMLVYDIGFQLSFLSVLGMAYLDKPIKHVWRYTDKGFLSWKDGVVSTLAVLAPMVPFVANVDGSFPLAAIPSNTLMFLATPFAMLYGWLVATTGLFSTSLGFFVAKIGSPIVLYQLFVIKLFSAVPIPLPIPFHIPIVIIVYYAAIAIFIFYYYEDD